MELQQNKFFNVIIPASFVFFLLAGIYSCGNNDVVNTGTFPTLDTSILVTDETGRVRGGDYSDWCLHDSTSGSGRSFGPAYPNPTNNQVSINLSIANVDTISLYFFNGTDSTFLIKEERLNAGYYTISTSASALHFENSYRRLYIRNKRGLYPAYNGCNNFGDIHFR